MAGSSPVVSEGAKKARIEIIPLIDVIFFLLATFVLFTLSLKHIRSIPLQLPVASAFTQSNPDDDLVTIQVSDEGTCYWDEHGNHELISVGEIQGRIDNYKRGTTNPRILIAGDDKAKFGPIVAVLDEVRKAGIDQVSVETRVRQTGH
jgi:biopolymer transport protein ExbD